MVVALIVPFKRAVHHITVDIDWPLSIIYLRNIDNQQRMSFVFNYINIFFDKDISVYFVAVQGIEELLFNFVGLLTPVISNLFAWSGSSICSVMPSTMIPPTVFAKDE